MTTNLCPVWDCAAPLDGNECTKCSWTSDIPFLQQIKMHSAECVDKIDVSKVRDLAQLVYSTLATGRKVMICGCGGSAADSQHFAAELVGSYSIKRLGLAAIALTTDTSILTAVGNDFHFTHIFERQVQALGLPNDLVIGISTSGSSDIVLNALSYAMMHSMNTILLTGSKYMPTSLNGTEVFIANSKDTARIQEVHGLVIHMICAQIERWMGTDTFPLGRNL